jgi:hypothetical protein
MRSLGGDNCNEQNLHGRSGVFRGAFRVKMGGVVGTVRRARLRGTIAFEPGDPGDCSDPLPIGGDEHLGVAGGGISALLFGSVGFVGGRPRFGPGWRQHDEIDVHHAGLFSDDLPPFPSGAPVAAHAQAGGPFLTGSFTFGPVSGFSTDDPSFVSLPGPVTGAMTARFDMLGGAATTMRPTEGVLTRECEQCI